MNERIAIGGNNPPSESEILKQRLESHADEEKLINELIAKPVPIKILSDKEAGESADLIKSLKSMRKSIGTIFTNEKEPFLVACRVADGWKNAKWDKIDAHVILVSMPIIEWNKEKEESERLRLLQIAKDAQELADKLAKEAEHHCNVGINDTADDLLQAAIEEEAKSNVLIASAAGKITSRSIGNFASASTRKKWVGVLENIDTLDIISLKKYFTVDEINKAIRGAVSDGVRELKGVNIFEEDKLTIR